MDNNAQTNWDDLRFVLAVAETGSVAAAGRSLGVNHATVLRRIAGFETKRGMKIFDKTPNGYRVSPDRRALIEALRAAAVAMGQVDRLIDAEAPDFSSGIRITSTDTFCQFIIAPIIPTIEEKLGIPISALSSNSHLDFSRLQADIAVRPSAQLSDELSGEIGAHFRFGLYAASGDALPLLGLQGAIARSSAGDWIREKQDGKQSRVTADSFAVLAQLAAAGQGRAILPVFLGDSTPGLHCIDALDELDAVPIWVASHRDVANSGRLRRARSMIVASLGEAEPRLMGQN